MGGRGPGEEPRRWGAIPGMMTSDHHRATEAPSEMTPPTDH